MHPTCIEYLLGAVDYCHAIASPQTALQYALHAVHLERPQPQLRTLMKLIACQLQLGLYHEADAALKTASHRLASGPRDPEAASVHHLHGEVRTIVVLLDQATVARDRRDHTCVARLLDVLFTKVRAPLCVLTIRTETSRQTANAPVSWHYWLAEALIYRNPPDFERAEATLACV
jgi:hypothetical protein